MPWGLSVLYKRFHDALFSRGGFSAWEKAPVGWRFRQVHFIERMCDSRAARIAGYHPKAEEGGVCPMATILLIDDDASVRRFFQTALEEAGYHVLSAGEAKAGLRLLATDAVDLVLVDIFMPDMDGLEVIQHLRTCRPGCPIIAMSGGSGDKDYLEVARYLGAKATLMKPCSVQDVVNTVAAYIIP